jgi:hypothetical protein
MFVHQGAGIGLELDASLAKMRLILMGDHTQNGSSSALSHTAMLQPPKERGGRDGVRAYTPFVCLFASV